MVFAILALIVSISDQFKRAMAVCPTKRSRKIYTYTSTKLAFCTYWQLLRTFILIIKFVKIREFKLIFKTVVL